MRVRLTGWEGEVEVPKTKDLESPSSQVWRIILSLKILGRKMDEVVGTVTVKRSSHKSVGHNVVCNMTLDMQFCVFAREKIVMKASRSYWQKFKF